MAPTSAPHAEVMGILIQADLDDELDTATARDLARHVSACSECQELTSQLRALKTALAIPRYPAPQPLREALLREASRRAPGTPTHRFPLRPRSFVPAAFLAGAAVAAGFVLAVLPRSTPEKVRIAAEVTTATERSLEPGHLFDTRVTMPEELAQWFRARIGFAPPLRVPQGFVLAGARLDYLHERPVAVLAYHHSDDLIELYAWPEQHVPTPPESLNAQGFTLSYWRADGVEFWAVGRSAEVLKEFVTGWRQSA